MYVLALQQTKIRLSQFVHYRLLHEREGKFLPSLKRIWIPGSFSVDLPAIFVTLSDNIKYVEDNSLSDETIEFTRTFLSLLGKRSPYIHHLVLRGGRSIDPSYILAFKSLQRLELRLANTFLSSNFIEDLGDLGDLVGLVLHVGPTTLTTPPTSLLGPTSLPKTSPRHFPRKFCYLKDLELIGTISAVSRFLGFTYLTRLTSLTIKEEPEPTDIQAERFWIESFGRLQVSPYFESVEIQQSAQRRWGHPDYSLSIHSISPLLRLRTLKHLKIEGGSFCATDDGIFETLKSLPNLIRLSLPEEWHTSCPTIAALAYISSNNPKLNELKIPLAGDIEHSCSIMSDSIDRTAHEHYNSQLRHLHLATRFGPLSLKQMVVLGKFLNRSFPLLNKLEGYGAYSASESWDQVHEVQTALQAEAKFHNAKN